MPLWEWLIDNNDDRCRKCKGKIKVRHIICVHCETWFPCTDKNKFLAFGVITLLFVLVMSRL
jgi:hypothetical protein